ncbi:hypothetical protein HB779_24955 (plasmid) [Phyllobacterium sp. 628]|uniref:hypothetical protein n=1 Tax=Phyllobacterium sp. 628 TaxID=2718938 RepID=UPI00166282F7|nr:hypothetical protein [Phyllobacterium sp. 628]QND55107.1 hypothetical protein HB779_24955 [Phyllobacterium sp. 628]
MEAAIEPIITIFLPLIVGGLASLIGVASILGTYQYGFSAERSTILGLLTLLCLFAVADYFTGIQTSVIIVLGVVAAGFAGAIVLKRTCLGCKITGEPTSSKIRL